MRRPGFFFFQCCQQLASEEVLAGAEGGDRGVNGLARAVRSTGQQMLSVEFGAGQFGCVHLPLIHKSSGVGMVVRSTDR